MTTPVPRPTVNHRLYLRLLARYLGQSKQILASWDVYSDKNSEPETHEPLDEATYGVRQRQRDTDTLIAFGRVYLHADELLDTAEQQLAALPTTSATQEYTWKVGELRTSTQRLQEIQSHWLTLRETLPADAMPGTSAYDEPLAESRAEAWPYLDQWGIHGQALIDINTLAQEQQRSSPDASVHVPPAPQAEPKAPPARR